MFTLANPVASPVYFSVYPAAGQAPLAVKFTVDDTIPKAKALYEIDYDGDGVADLSVPTHDGLTDGLTHMYTTEGLYFPLVTIKDADGNVYTKTIVVDVFRMPDLKAKWDTMRTALEQGKVDEAVKYIATSSRESYRKNFATLAEKAPQAIQEMATDMANIRIYETGNNYALGDFIVVEDGKEVSYGVQFMKDEDGIWRIRNY